MELKEAKFALIRDFASFPIVATEIEFYLFGADGLEDIAPLKNAILNACAAQGIGVFKWEAEKGPEQYEIALLPDKDVCAIADKTSQLKRLISEEAAKFDVKADFSAKPLPDQPGSGLHVHVHLENADGINLFTREVGDGPFSEPLLFSIGGLLETMRDRLPAFAPDPDSLKRFAAGSNAPTTISWGTNNRTVAIRLPTKPLNNKHIEHRVAGADADPEAVIAAILQGMHYGLEGKISPGEPIYGDAALAMYAKERIFN